MENYNFYLPKKLIAQEFAEPRDSARLMVVNSGIRHLRFYNIIEYLNKGDVLVINTTKVARRLIDARTQWGGKAEIIVEEPAQDMKGAYRCRVKGAGPRIGKRYLIDKGLHAMILGQGPRGEFYMGFSGDIIRYLDNHGKLPYPFYVKKTINEHKYQTIYCKDARSLAAPTAGLHFTDRLISSLKSKGVVIAEISLDISFATFLKPTANNFRENRLHKEKARIDKHNAMRINSRKGRLVVCGTTSIRALEAFADDSGDIRHGEIETELFIRPGYQFRSRPDMLITNFHLPKSSLLLMVCAFSGTNSILNSYKEAIRKGYRFYSLGDAMLLMNPITY